MAKTRLFIPARQRDAFTETRHAPPTNGKRHHEDGSVWKNCTRKPDGKGGRREIRRLRHAVQRIRTDEADYRERHNNVGADENTSIYIYIWVCILSQYFIGARPMYANTGDHGNPPDNATTRRPQYKQYTANVRARLLRTMRHG